MSKDDEMVTITYEVTLVEAEGMASKYGCHDERGYVAAKKALAGRKTKYERWRDGFNTAPHYWRTYLEKQHELGPSERIRLSEDEARLMGASPGMLEVLIAVVAHDIELFESKGTLSPDYQELHDRAKSIIKHILPKDVADEVLGDE